MDSIHHKAIPRTHLDFLDGLRGCAALYVVFFHCWQSLTWYQEFPLWLHAGLGWACAGRQAVTVFIVLSGFVLTLPVARSGSLEGGLPGFAYRRARRILPLWFAVLIASAVLLHAAPSLFADASLYANHTYPRRPWFDGFTHAILVQALDPPGIYAYVGPGWSLSTECLIYVAFAIALIPVRQRAGPGAAVSLGLVSAGVLWWLMPAYRVSAFWFVGCFCLGMAAAEVTAGRWQTALRLPWEHAAVIFWAGLAATLAVVVLRGKYDLLADTTSVVLPIIDLAIGLATAATIISMTVKPGLGCRFLASRPIAWLGRVSYSVYLVHGPLVAAAGSWAVLEGLSLPYRAVVLLGVAIPGSLILAAISYSCIERPFLRK